MVFDGSVCIREVSLPLGVHGAIMESPDGIANIYINQRDPEEEKIKTLHHEMRHYVLGHIGSDKRLTVIESEAEE